MFVQGLFCPAGMPRNRRGLSALSRSTGICLSTSTSCALILEVEKRLIFRCAARGILRILYQESSRRCCRFGDSIIVHVLFPVVGAGLPHGPLSALYFACV